MRKPSNILFQLFYTLYTFMHLRWFPNFYVKFFQKSFKSYVTKSFFINKSNPNL